jgi:FkbM family methyltransferase
LTLRQLLGGRITLRQWAKYHIYGFAGKFPYFGCQVYFPKACSAFKLVCAHGIFEAENTRLLQHLCRPGSHMFDVGANLGLMALPVLRSVPESKVVSFEPSPNTVEWLRRTVAQSGFGERWELVEKAVGCNPGPADFSLSAPTEGLYDGLKYTGRTNEARTVQVEVTSLDLEWERLGRPPVSVIKIDVEGGELNVLRGAQELLARTRPFVLSEWCNLNFRAYNIPCHALFRFANEHEYLIYSLPEIIRVSTPADLELQSIRTESFLMVPLCHSSEPATSEGP